jgi:hypothetical protein
MTVDEFAALPQAVIDEEGFDEFCPSVCLPARRDVRTLAGIPNGQNQETAALQWISDIAEHDEEVLVVFKINATQFKVVRKVGTTHESRIYTVATHMSHLLRCLTERWIATWPRSWRIQSGH